MRVKGQWAAQPADYAATVKTPFAVLGIRTDGAAVTGVEYLMQDTLLHGPRNRVAARALAEILDYLKDPESPFTVPLAPRGTPFQRKVWDAIRTVPLRESRTYGEIARAVRSAPRAVGQACGANRIALIIPCHRIVGSHGALGGFMGAAGSPQCHRPLQADDPLAIKRWLLRHEGYRFGA